MNRKLYLAYGSNLNLRQMQYRCPDARVVGTAILQDYKLLFRGNRHRAVATVEPCKGEQVPVLIWSISSDDERALDAYEGWPRLYRKENLTAEVAGKPTAVMAYVMTDGFELGAPSPGYFATILDGYRDNGLDPAFLHKAAKASTPNEMGW